MGQHRTLLCKIILGQIGFPEPGRRRKPFEIVARLKDTSLPSSVRSNSIISNSTSVAQTKHKADFIAYTRAVENRMPVLQTETDKAYALTVPPRVQDHC